MIKYNQLKITPDDKFLNLDFEIMNEPNVWIRAIIIDNQDTYISNSYSMNPVYRKDITDDISKISLSINSDEITSGIAGNLFFVYILLSGSEEDNIVRAVVFNDYKFYQNFTKYLKELSNSCEIPMNIINEFLRYQALLMSIKTGKYQDAINFWNEFKVKPNINTNNCGCHAGYY